MTVTTQPNRCDNRISLSAYSRDICYTRGAPVELLLSLKFSDRTPKAEVEITLPQEMCFQEKDIGVNIIGRGETLLTELERQFPGRAGIGHQVTVGKGSLERREDGTCVLRLCDLDLRPDNGADVQIRIPKAMFEREGISRIKLRGKADIAGQQASVETDVELSVENGVTDFHRVLSDTLVYDTQTEDTQAAFAWTQIEAAAELHLLHSDNYGKSWRSALTIAPTETKVQVRGMEPEKEHWFCLEVTGGPREGRSNIAKVYSGKYNVRTAAGAPTDGSNAAKQINQAIAYMHRLGGGTVLFEGGCFHTTTVALQSNVTLYIDKSAEIHALSGCDDEEKVWYSDEEYRADQSHMSRGPYLTPDNWMTKQDAGHSYFHNALFFGERLDNVKIIGNGRISGEHNLTKSNTVMENESGSRADKMIALKLCTNVEIGGLSVGKDLWYEETEEPNHDQPFYLEDDGRKSACGIENMLKISNGGHFVVLATGVDGISTHDIYAEKGPQVRDIFDYMGCNDILACNIYAEGAPDDVVKLGSDCSLGFTRTSRNCIVRNIIGDTSCNLFQIGSETADDIQDVCIDNLYVLASDKAGFSISVNDGGHIRNVHLNCGGSMGCCEHGVEHGQLSIGYEPAKINPHRSRMRRVRNPLFLSLSNRGRVLGSEAVEREFLDDTGVPREELMIQNVNIGRIENVFLKHLDVREVYAASQAKSETKSRWPAYDGQARTTALIVGYKIPDKAGMRLPDGEQGRHIENVVLEDIDIVVKGGNPPEDARNTPRELGVGQFNLRNLAEDERASKIPAYGYYVRHVTGMTLRNCTVDFEENDDRYAVVMEDVQDITIENFKAPDSLHNREKIKISKGEFYV